MEKETRPYARKSAYDPDVTRVVGVRIKPETLKQLRLLATEDDLTVSSLLRREAERLAAGTASH
jgi:hypothetical protein